MKAQPIVPCAALLFLAAACSTAPAPALPPAARPAPRPEPEPLLELAAPPPAFVDRDSLVQRLRLELTNRGAAELRVESIAWTLRVEGREEPLERAERPDRVLPAGARAVFELELPLELGELDEAVRGDGGPASAALAALARVCLVRAGDAGLELAARAELSVPIVREPRLRIRSIKVGRDILVTTSLGIGVEVENPNDFPLELDRIIFDFYGEGMPWASGADGGALAVPARGRAERVLATTMSFAEMDRRLLDLVAGLKVIRYRLAGRSRVRTGLEALPAFEAAFDESGSCAVER